MSAARFSDLVQVEVANKRPSWRVKVNGRDLNVPTTYVLTHYARLELLVMEQHGAMAPQLTQKEWKLILTDLCASMQFASLD